MKRLIILLAVFATPAFSDAPNIDHVAVHKSGKSWRFDVTISHADTGWDDYADGWRVLDMQGNELGLRILHHPHVTEQPFTRSLGGVEIPKNTKTVQIEARDNIGGWSGAPVIVTLR
ncbi:MAG: hypothetical protein AB8B71_06275 [Paracoccaceae bacterium]